MQSQCGISCGVQFFFLTITAFSKTRCMLCTAGVEKHFYNWLWLTLRSNLVYEMKVVASVDLIWCLCSPPFQHVALWNFPSSTCLVCCDCCIVSIAVCRLSVSNSISLHPLLCLPQMVKWATDQWGVDDVCGNNWAPPFLGWRACLPPPHCIPHWTTKTRIYWALELGTHGNKGSAGGTDYGTEREGIWLTRKSFIPRQVKLSI